LERNQGRKNRILLDRIGWAVGEIQLADKCLSLTVLLSNSSCQKRKRKRKKKEKNKTKLKNNPQKISHKKNSTPYFY
jgi:hypothetical protein